MKQGFAKATMAGLLATLLTSCSSSDTPQPQVRSVAPLACAHQEHELPIVTHWNSQSGVEEYLASDNLVEELSYQSNATYQPGCHVRWTLGNGTPFLPQHQQYLGSSYALERVSAADANQWSTDVCEEVGQAIQLLRPDAWHSDGIDLTRVQADAPYLQAIHGVQISAATTEPGSLATVVLPRNWNPNPATPYPIVAHSYYDLNLTTFRVPQGRALIDMVASSTEDDRTGAIGIIFNGNAGKVGYTHNENAYRDFGALIDRVADDLAADRHSIVIYGGSRGGSSAMNFAANPFDLDYTVLFAAGGASATHASQLMQLVPSFTYPRSAEIVTEVSGFHDAWRPGWQYPDCGLQQYHGQSITDVITDVLYGVDLDSVDLQTPYADANIQRLLTNGTGVYMSIGRNDVLPPAAQLDFAQKMVRLGVNAEVSVVSRGGHGGLRNTNDKAKAALLSVLDNQTIASNPGLHHFAANHDTGDFSALSLADGEFAFVMEAPRVVARGMTTPWVFSGTPGTEYTAQLLPPPDASMDVISVSGAIPDELDSVFSTQSLLVPESYAAGEYTYALSIRKPGQDWQTVPSTNTPAPGNVPATLTVLESVPDVSGEALSEFIENAIPEHPLIPGGTAWGLSEF